MSASDEAFLRELLAAFQVEAAEHVQAITAGLLELERDLTAEARTSALESVYREAHSLKGAARAVDLGTVEAVCQSFESALRAVRHGEVTLTPDLLDLLHQTTDAVSQLLAGPDGETVPVAELVHQLNSLGDGASGPAGDVPAAASAVVEPAPRALASTPTTHATSAAPSAPPAAPRESAPPAAVAPPEPTVPAVQPPPAPLAPAPSSALVAPPAVPAPSERPRRPAPVEPAPHDGPAARDAAPLAETVRISTAKLDALFLQAEEMLAAKLAAEQHAADLRDLKAVLEMWRKEWARFYPEIRVLRQGMERHGMERQGAGDGRREASPLPSRLLAFLEWSEGQLQATDGRVAALTRAAERDYHTVGGMVDGLLDSFKSVLTLPFSSVLELLPKMVRDLSRDQAKEIDLSLSGQEVEIDRRILEQMKDPLIHLLRNCVDHGVERPAERLARGKPRRGNISLAVWQVEGNRVEIRVADDGGGIDPGRVREAAVRRGVVTREEAAALSDQEAIWLIFRSEVSTSQIISDLSGRGLGLAIVREKVDRLGGLIALETRLGVGTAFRLTLPVTLATFRGVLVEAAGRPFVLPLANVERVVRVPAAGVRTIAARETISLDGSTLPLALLSDLLELPRPAPGDARAGAPPPLSVLVVFAAERRVALAVERVVGEQEVLVKGLGPQLVRVRNVAGATVLGSGKVVPILNPADLVLSAVRLAGAAASAPPPSATPAERQRAVLVVEDSITSRMLLKSILESAGYVVRTAVDGVEALAALREQSFDAVVSDVEMPRLNGFDLTARIRADKKLADLPVVLVTALSSPADRERGVDVGADAYIVKSSFDQSNLLATVRRLIV